MTSRFARHAAHFGASGSGAVAGTWTTLEHGLHQSSVVPTGAVLPVGGMRHAPA